MTSSAYKHNMMCWRWGAAKACAALLLVVCRFPHCLFMLELLQSEHFRQAIALPQVAVRAAAWRRCWCISALNSKGAAGFDCAACS